MLHLHHGNRIEALVDGLAEATSGGLADAFTTDQVLVGSRGMERWLAMQLAARWGVCADVQFGFLGPAVASWLAVVAGTPVGEAWTADGLVWRLARALPKRLTDAGFEALRDWVRACAQVEDDGVLRLAARLAPVLAEYPVWRPEEARRWRVSGRPVRDDADWTTQLGRALAADTDEPLLHERVEAFEAALAAPQAPAGLPARVSLFCPGVVAPLHQRVFAALARHREVHVWTLQPSGTAWARRRTDAGAADRHPLASASGQAHRDFQIGWSRHAHVDHDHEVVGAGAGLLAGLRDDLRRDEAPRAPRAVSRDGSLSIHACPGAMREVETLRELLIRALDDDPTLEPRDIAVLTPDIDTYGPLLTAVLGDGGPSLAQAEDHPSGLPALPTLVGDRGPSRDNPVAVVLMAVLDLLGRDRFDAPALEGLLALAPVQARLGLADGALDQVRRWLNGSGARWSIDAAHRIDQGQPDDDRYTWRFALDRLLLGSAVSDHDVVLGALPYGAVNGKDDRNALGAIAGFVDRLIDLRERLRGPFPMDVWADRIGAALDDLVDTRGWQAHAARRVVQEMARQAAQQGFGDRRVHRATLAGFLSERFGQRDAGRSFLAGGVTVSQLVPLRAIPFRVVALVGMNAGEFPRNPVRAHFDRLSQPEGGDPTPRLEDRALFLETVLAARDRLIVTYTGRDPSDGSHRPPAVPVGELLDAVGEAFGDEVRREVHVEHPLRAFDPRLFEGPTPHADRRHLSAARATLIAPDDAEAPPPTWWLPEPDARVLPLNELKRFLKAPMQRLLARRLRLRFDKPEAPVPDREPLEVDALGEWGLRNAWISARMSEGTGRADWLARERRDSRVPRGTPGEVSLDKVAGQAEAVLEAAGEAMGGASQEERVRLFQCGRTLEGRVGWLAPEGLVHVSASKPKYSHLLDLWIDLLAWTAAGNTVKRAVLVQHDAKKPAVRDLEPMDAADAVAQLEGLIALYDLGQRGPLPLLEEVSGAWAHELAKTGDPDKADAAAFADWQPNEAEAAVLDGRHPLDEALDALWPGGLDFRTAAERLWTPLLSALRLPEKRKRAPSPPRKPSRSAR